MFCRYRVVAWAIMVSVLLSGVSIAQEETSVLEENKSYKGIPNMIGVAVAVRSEPYKGMDTEAIPLPILSWSYERFYLKGPLAGIHIFDQEYFYLDVLIY